MNIGREAAGAIVAVVRNIVPLPDDDAKDDKGDDDDDDCGMLLILTLRQQLQR